MKKMLSFILAGAMLFGGFGVLAWDYALPKTLSTEQQSVFLEKLNGEKLKAVSVGKVPTGLGPALDLAAKGAVLMEASTGQVLYEQNGNEPLAPASITKIMTLILIMEELEAGRLKLDDPITVSENAANMGGSQIYMKPGESLSVDEMLKSIVVVSANDACVAMAEQLAGSTDLFVAQMNEKAKKLGMEHTHFVNCHGLDAEGHQTTAYDVALMSRELLKHELIHTYSTIWMDTVRDGQFQLANTNKLLKTYPGITGLKTGSTSTAKYCLSASAKRENMELIGVVMGAETGKIRFAEAARLLDYGFGAFSKVVLTNEEPILPIPVLKGKKKTASVVNSCPSPELVIAKNLPKEVRVETEMAENITAPAEKGQKVGKITYFLNDEQVGTGDILVDEAVLAETYMGYFNKLLQGLFLISATQ